MVRTNIGGWHSNINLQDLGHPALTRLYSEVLKTAEQVTRDLIPRLPDLRKEDWRIESWLNANGKDALNTWHDHCSYNRDHSNLWAAVYYVDGGQPDGDTPQEGEIMFRDDFLGPHMELYTPGRSIRTVEFTPKTGTFFIFPSWLRHSVKPYRGLGERVSIAINLAHPAISIDKKPDYRRFPWAWKCAPGLMKKLRKISPFEL
ncbi:putative 2OG-Fe(II) oxygenase [Emcibacter sp.]|uniref:putative 2OG-Fe(II) oxygenase n=1 Tax=Emcibacter sp. TaxID=1979954 RepID=UPI002AA617E9|nr:putative 2OG-Fe(II) oxygenase [Emcibacter sp.]